MTSAITRLKLLGDRADELTKWQADVELREAEARERQAAREARAQQKQAANNWENWWAAIDERIQQHIEQCFSNKDSPYIGGIGEALGCIQAQVRKEFQTAIDKLRNEVGEADDKLSDELRDAFDRLPVVDQERREHERALSQTNLDARDARIAGAVEAATVKLRSEFGDADDKLRDELRDALDRLSVVDQERRERERALSQTNLDARNARIAGAIEAATVKLRSECDVAGGKLRDELRDELRVKLGRLPVVEPWEPERVFYRGDVVTHNGSTFQARKDTGQPPDHQDWTCLAHAGRNGCDGLSPNVCGAFDAHKTYARLDIVVCHDAAFIARRDDPGICPGDGWQLLSQGKAGRRGETGKIGPRGEKGDKGEAAPTIVNWTLDRKRYRAIPTMSDGKPGAPLELRGLCEQFCDERDGTA